MPSLRRQLLAIFLRRKFRPWALLTPILVLLVALPLLRPLRSPGGAAPAEAMLLDTVRSLSTRGSLALDPIKWANQPGTVRASNGRVYPDRPPTFAVLLAGPAWAMRKAGLKFDNDESLVAYLLTLIGTTIPVAVGASVFYRMGRLFELSRPQRAVLASLVAFGSGWISYATVLNPHAPAAAALMCACACLLWLAAAKRSIQALPICLLSGLLCATAAATSPWTLPLVLPLPLVLFAMQIPKRQKVVGFLLMTIGAAPLAWTHVAWSLDAYGSVLAPGSVSVVTEIVRPDAAAVAATSDGFDDAEAAGRTRLAIDSLFTVTLGSHGLLSHFPLAIVGLVGLSLVLRKHWPMHAKMLAGITLAGGLVVVALVALRPSGVGGWMFAVVWFVAFAPLLTFWSGAVMRRDLTSRQWWAVAGACVASVVVSLAGALDPLPRRPYTQHTAIGAIERWVGQDGAHASFDAREQTLASR